MPIEPPLRVLLLISSPPSLGENSRVDVESERVAVEQAVHKMRERGFLHLVIEDVVTPKRAERLLDHFKPHIVHYIGHGEYDQTYGSMLLWEDDQGNVLPLSARRLASLLHSRNLHAVVLHACETGRSNARAEVQSLVDTLTHEGLPAILAQQANFTYELSQLASHVWNQALVTGQSIALAVLAVRQRLIEAERPDWAVPILQGGTAILAPVIAAASLPGVADPLLTRVGAAADLQTPKDVFVGRYRELRTLRLMLEDVSNNGPILAFITGPGGMGKSTLAVQAVTRYGGSYKAALMLHCQEYQGIDLFLQSMGKFLKRLGAPLFLEHTLPDPKLSTEAKLDEAVVAMGAAGPVLLVIDNLESVQNEDQMISDKDLLYLLQALLTNIHRGRVLITGRYMMKELPLQANFRTKFLHLGLDDLSRHETSQLLLRYSSLARLSKVVRQKLVDEFGGLPSVYHLLSSQAATQDLEQMIYEVREYGAVKQKMITEKHKQRTAEEWQKIHSEVAEFAALEVIITRLSQESRTLLAQLGVLYRPFPLAAIEDGLGIVRAVWQPLLDWSLLHYDAHEKTYRLQSLTKRYAKSLLEEQLRKQTQMQLAAWYVHYARHDSHHLEDCLEAHRLMRAAGALQQAGELVQEIAEPLLHFGLYPLLQSLWRKTLDDISKYDERLAGYALFGLGIIADRQGKNEEARHFYHECLEIERRLDNQYGQASLLNNLGLIAYNQGENEEARRLYHQSLGIYEQLGEQVERATLLNNLGNMARKQGEHEEARRLYHESLEIKKLLGDESGQASTLRDLGTLARDQGEYEEAYRLSYKSLEISERLGDQDGQAKVLHQLGTIAYLQGEYEKAQLLYHRSLTITERLGDQKGRAVTLHQLGSIAHNQGKYEEAQQFYHQSLELLEQSGTQNGRAGILCNLGSIAQGQGKYEQAQQFYHQGLELSERLGDQNGRAAILHHLGTIAQDQGEYEQARGLYHQSLEIKERLGDLHGRATSLHQLGTIAHLQGEYEQARGLYHQSLTISERLGNQAGQASSLHHLGVLAQDQGEYEEARRLY